MSLRFLNASDSKYFADKLRRKHLWLALNDGGELKVSQTLIGCGNNWLDVIAYLKENEPQKFQELISC